MMIPSWPAALPQVVFYRAELYIVILLHLWVSQSRERPKTGRRREEHARHTRQRVVDAALRLFLERGYVATTIKAIAREAAVAPATVYQAFGTKQAILARILDQTIAGDAGPAALLDRDWVEHAGQHPDPRQRLALVMQHASQVAARTAPIKEVMRDAAAADPAVQQLLQDDDQRRYGRTQPTLVNLVIGEDYCGQAATATTRQPPSSRWSTATATGSSPGTWTGTQPTGSNGSPASSTANCSAPERPQPHLDHPGTPARHLSSYAAGGPRRTSAPPAHPCPTAVAGQLREQRASFTSGCPAAPELSSWC